MYYLLCYHIVHYIIVHRCIVTPTTQRHVTILDAPGHRDYIPKLLTGVIQADIAMLIVSYS